MNHGHATTPAENSNTPIRSDSEIKQAVQAAFRLDPRVSAFSPDVTVEDGVVILGGTVGNLKAKTSAEQDAKNIVGVWRVDNFLKVRPKRRPTDAEMTSKLTDALFWDAWLDNATVNASVNNRVANRHEASQSDVMGLLALSMANKAIVVGDHEQVVRRNRTGPRQVQHLIDEYLDGVPNAHLYDGQTWIYDLARQSFGGTIRLVEHFRCVPEIIQFSNQLSYEGAIRALLGMQVLLH